jgi:uncharacterized protein (DUF697 family)
MSKSKTNMPYDIKEKCRMAIHTATAASAVAGAIPIPMSDTIPITGAQVAMLVSLGKVFDLTISESVARSILSVTLTQQAGRAIATNVLKCIPGVGTIVGGVISAATAATLTEALGWMIADDFYRASVGEETENIGDAAEQVKGLFEGTRFPKNKKQASN